MTVVEPNKSLLDTQCRINTIKYEIYSVENAFESGKNILIFEINHGFFDLQ